MYKSSHQSFTRHHTRTSRALILVLVVFANLVLFGQSAWSADDTHSVITDFSGLKWKPWKGLPEGAEIAILWGDQKTGPSDAVVKFPPGYQFPHHHHSARELLVWMQGEFIYTADDGTTQQLGPMAYLNLAPGTKHSVRCGKKESCILYLTFDEPVDLHEHPLPEEKPHAH